MPNDNEDLEKSFGISNIGESDKKKVIKEALSYAEDQDDLPEYITLVSWVVMHECSHMGCDETLKEINDGCVFQHNDFDYDHTLMLYAFDGSNANEMMGSIEGLCGGDHYKLVNGQYEVYKPDMIGGINLSNEEELKKAITDFTKRNQPLIIDAKQQSLNKELQKNDRLN